MNAETLNTWVELSEKAYAHNLAFFKRKLKPQTELAVVIKANAYGHGMVEIARLAERHGADSFCVHSLEEAQTLREEGFSQDVLIMGPVARPRLREVVTGDFRLVVYDRETVAELGEWARELKKPIRVHLKLETGTHRQGVDTQELQGLLEQLKATPDVLLEAAYTHFANIEDTTDHGYAFAQIRRFDAGIDQVKRAGFTSLKKHAACSAATLLFPETHFDMVRLGISQYGLWPSRETFVSYKIKQAQNGDDVLRPVLSWKVRVAQVKDVPANNFIGYGCTYQTTRDSRVAVLPVGYSDGYDRRLSNQSFVLLQNRRAPVRGRICMNFIMVDVTDISGVSVGDEAVLIGSQGKERVTADGLAGLMGTINYEVVTRISPHIPRFIVN